MNKNTLYKHTSRKTNEQVFKFLDLHPELGEYIATYKKLASEFVHTKFSSKMTTPALVLLAGYILSQRSETVGSDWWADIQKLVNEEGISQGNPLKAFIKYTGDNKPKGTGEMFLTTMHVASLFLSGEPVIKLGINPGKKGASVTL